MYKLYLSIGIQLAIIVNCYSLAQNCGKFHSKPQDNELDANILGGVDAAPGEFPWQVILANSTTKLDFCGGTIINDQWILSATHCVISMTRITDFQIRLGVQNRSIHSLPEYDFNVEKVINYDDSIVPNDIVLIKLTETLDFQGKHKHLEPICLPTPDTKLTDDCMATGFGYIDNDGNRPEILQKVKQTIFDTNKCKQLYSFLNVTAEVCAGGSHTGGIGVCEADSGGPLQCKDTQGVWYQVGVVSLGESPCGSKDVPDIYARVATFYDWINHVIKTN